MKKILLALIASAAFVSVALADDVPSAGQAIQQGQGQVLQKKQAEGTLGQGMQKVEDACKNSSDPNCKEKMQSHRQAVREQNKENLSQSTTAQ